MKPISSLIPIENFETHYSQDITREAYFGFPAEPVVEAEEKLLSPKTPSVAYFSMEYGLSANTYNAMSSLHPVDESNQSTHHNVFSNMRAMDYYLTVRTGHRLDIPIYSGGLGVLAGDTLKSAADRGVSLVAVGILWNKGYFKQNFWFKDGQIPEENNWSPSTYPGLVPLKTRIQLALKKETITLRLWKYYVYRFDKKSVIPLVLLDSNIPENSEFAQKLTDQLYRSDNAEWKILQRTILGMGGVKALEKLGYAIDRFHLNEGHAALAFVEKAKNKFDNELQKLKTQFCYTCHTPVAAGHDRFQKKALQEILRDEEWQVLKKFGQDPHYSDLINLTEFCMNTCEHVNAVAKKHGEVTRLQFPQHKERIQSITNGVHTHTWLSESVGKLLEKHKKTIGNWREDPTLLKKAADLKNNNEFREELWKAHQENKQRLAQVLKGWSIDPNVFTICWSRRIAAYKRPSLILQDVRRLVEITKKVGPIQVIFAGKAHPKDDIGFTYVNEMLTAIDSLEHDRSTLRVLMLENYDTYFGKLLASSVDVWLNNPLPPFEASGTSGMKAILNGVLQLSTLDGWVVEAADKNVGWIFGWEHHGEAIGDEKQLRLMEDSSILYEMLEKIVGLYYKSSSEWTTKMIDAIAAAGYFNTDRMVAEYQKDIWRF